MIKWENSEVFDTFVTIHFRIPKKKDKYMIKRELLACLLLATALFSCKQEQTDKKAQIKMVKSELVRSANANSSFAFPGKVKAEQEADVAFRSSGPIAQILVKEGQFVRRGQVLAKLDSRDYEIQLSATTAEYKRIKSEVDRIIKLYKEQSVSENEYDKAVFGLQQISAKYNAHKNALKDTELKAPYDGYIVGKPLFGVGEMVKAGMPILRLNASKQSVVEINIPASEYFKRGDFASYDCTFDVFPNQRFALKLLSIDQTANLNQLYKVRFKLINKSKQNAPTPGMTTMVYIKMKNESKGSVLVSNNAVFQSEGKSCVWLIKEVDGHKEVQKAVIYIEEILKNGDIRCTGVQENALIVSAGAKELKDKAIIRLISKETKTNVGNLL